MPQNNQKFHEDSGANLGRLLGGIFLESDKEIPFRGFFGVYGTAGGEIPGDVGERRASLTHRASLCGDLLVRVNYVEDGVYSYAVRHNGDLGEAVSFLARGDSWVLEAKNPDRHSSNPQKLCLSAPISDNSYGQVAEARFYAS